MNSESNVTISTRIDWIDLYRGILIFLVCLGHRSSTNGFVMSWLYSFHIPAFFFISGYLVKDSDYKYGIVEYVKRILIKMVIPYFLLGIIYIFANYAYCIFYNRAFSVLEWLKSLLTTNQFQESVNIGPIWFLHSLICVKLISLFLNQIRISSLYSGSFLAIIGLLLIEYKESLDYMMIGNTFFFGIPTILLGIFFYECGHSLKRKQHLIKVLVKPWWKKSLIIGCAIITNLLVSVRINSRVDLRYTSVGNPLLFLIGAFSGIVFTYYIVEFVMHIYITNRFFVFYGRNTLTVMAFHYFPGFIILETLSYRLLGVAYGQNSLSGRGEGTLYAMLVLILLTPLILFFNKYAPAIVGKSKSS